MARKRAPSSRRSRAWSRGGRRLMNSLRSAPALNVSPVPPRVTARTSVSSRARASAACSARTIDGLSALRASGRFSRSARMPSARCSRSSPVAYLFVDGRDDGGLEEEASIEGFPAQAVTAGHETRPAIERVLQLLLDRLPAAGGMHRTHLGGRVGTRRHLELLRSGGELVDQ